MENKSSVFILIGYIYVILPVLIFFIGFCNIPTSIAGTIVILFCSYLLYKNCPKIWFPSTKKDWGILVLTAFISLLWVCSSGIGALVFQNLDHNCRNPLFELLVNMNWPPVSADGSTILTYYIGFWLPSAVIGKLFHSVQIGYYCQIIWAFIGVFLTFCYIFSELKHKSLIPVIIFIFFSGLDILGCILTNQYQNYNSLLSHIEWWFRSFQFSSFTTQLYWVFNQAIPAWIITMLLYKEKNNKNIILIYSCMFLCSTLPAIGIIPMLFWWIIKNEKNDLHIIFSKNHLINAVKSCFSFSNIAGGLMITFVCYTYLSGNISGGYFSISFPNNITAFLYWFCLFYMLEAGLYLLCTFTKQKNNPLFYICAISLLIYPFIHIGLANDFCMRATIPALLIIYLFIVKAFDDAIFLNNKFLFLLLSLFLAIGSITPIHEMTRTFVMTSKGITKVKPNLHGSNFFGYVHNNKFIKFFAKKRSRSDHSLVMEKRSEGK